MVLAVAIMMRNERVEIVLVMSRAMAPYNAPWLFPCHVHGPAKIQLHELAPEGVFPFAPCTSLVLDYPGLGGAGAWAPLFVLTLNRYPRPSCYMARGINIRLSVAMRDSLFSTSLVRLGGLVETSSCS